jgi:hypothetical protein
MKAIEDWRDKPKKDNCNWGYNGNVKKNAGGFGIARIRSEVVSN